MLPLLIPILTELASNGLNLISSAIMAKGKDVVEDTLGVKLDDSLATQEGIQKLKQLQFDHEEKLLSLSLEDRKLDFSFYQSDAEDRANARAREIAIIQAPDAGWLNHNLVAILALIVIFGGSSLLMLSDEQDVKFAVTSMMTLVLGYFFGSSKSSSTKDNTISNLTK